MPKKLTTEEFIIRAQKIHKDKYDYSLVKYKNSQSKVKIICPDHGVFEQKPNDHTNGAGCPYCAGNIKLSKKEIIKQFRKIHKDKYDYSLVQYKNSSTKVKIICPIHGEFEQYPTQHKNGAGCPKCAGNKKLTWEEVIKRFKKVYKNKYDYSLITKEWFQENYKNTITKFPIICKEHGLFYQSLNNHLSNHGCSKCANENNSKGELAIREYLNFSSSKIAKLAKKEQITILEQFRLNNSRQTFDFFIPELNLAIEYDGIFHFKNIRKFNNLKDTKTRDFLKNKYCFINNINLIRIPYWEFDKKSKEEFFLYLDKIFRREKLV